MRHVASASNITRSGQDSTSKTLRAIGNRALPD